MLIGYARVSKADGSQAHDLQRDALVAAGITADQIYEDSASGRRDDRPGLDACLKALRADETPPMSMLGLLAEQLACTLSDFDLYADRSPTLREHRAQAEAWLGMRPFLAPDRRTLFGSVANMGHGRAASPSWGIRQHWRNAY